LKIDTKSEFSKYRMLLRKAGVKSSDDDLEVIRLSRGAHPKTTAARGGLLCLGRRIRATTFRGV
jgi:hypothetical protein